MTLKGSEGVLSWSLPLESSHEVFGNVVWRSGWIGGSGQ